MKLSKILPYLLLLLLIGVYLVTSYDPLSAKVNGRVFWNDELINLKDSYRGKVVFRPVNGGANSTGVIDSSGSYTVGTGSHEAIAPGDYLVSVSVIEVLPPEKAGDLPEGIPVTPRDYANPTTSGLTCVVKRGENVHDIHIEGPAYVVPVEPDSDLDSGEESETNAEISSEQEDAEGVEGSVEEDSQPTEAMDVDVDDSDEVTLDIKEEVSE